MQRNTWGWTALLTIFLLFFSQPFITQGQNFPVCLIPDTLRQSAGAVIRESIMDIRVHSSRKVVVHQKLVITVFSEEDDHYARFGESYSSFKEFKKLSGVIYNESGNVVREIKSSGFKDHGDYTGDNLFSDIRYKSVYPVCSRLPCTVAYEWEVEYSGTLSLPVFSPLRAHDLPVQYARLTIDYSLSDSVRIRELNLPCSSVKDQLKNQIHYELELRNLRRCPVEDFQPERMTFLPTVIVVPESFSMEGTRGSFLTWKSFGEWIYSLAGESGGISSETTERIKSLTRTGTREEKIQAVYRFMQSRTRYVNITIGIGGWKPASPATVDKLGYGDCKALTEYTRALLAVAGIDSYYTLVYASDDLPLLFRDFPYNCFNHAILCVPDTKDTLWLECTNPWYPAGFLGSSVLNRPALMITPSGGVLIHTQKSNRTESELRHTGAIRLDTAGNGVANLVNWYGGTFYEDRLPLINASAQDKKEQLLKEIMLTTMRLKRFDHIDLRDSILLIREYLEYELAGFASRSQNRLMFTPAFISGQRVNPFLKKIRKTPIVIPLDYTLSDSLCFEIPQGYDVAYFPENMNLETPYGRLQTRIRISERAVFFSRSLLIRSGLWKTSDYPGIHSFIKQVASADKEMVVLEKHPNVKD